MGDPRLMPWREVIEANPYYQRLSPEERDDAEARAKWTVANLGKAGVLGCADLASLACEQGLALEQLREELAEARQRLTMMADTARGAA